MSESKYLSIPSQDDKENELLLKLGKAGRLKDVDIEITSRCNLRCRHCYIKEAGNNQQAKDRELSVEQWHDIMRQVAAMGALNCTITGGDPLLRKDFKELYLMLKREGFLITVYSNLTLLSDKLFKLFEEYPPMLLESTVYGVSDATYSRVTGIAGAFTRFKQNVERIRQAGIPLGLKAMLLHSNLCEAEAIVDYCIANSDEPPRFDAALVLRHDGDAGLNAVIRDERLTGEEIVSIFEQSPTIASNLDSFFETGRKAKDYLGKEVLFTCSAGIASATIGADGIMRPCSLLVHPDYLFDLKKMPVHEAFRQLQQKVRNSKVASPELYPCSTCELRGACMTCPAINYLETGSLEKIAPSLCDLSHKVVSFNKSKA